METVKLLSDEEITALNRETPEMMAISTFLNRFCDDNGVMVELVEDEEFIEMQNKDSAYKQLCDLLLVEESPKEVNILKMIKAEEEECLSLHCCRQKMSSRQKFKVELDRAIMWHGLHDD